ncbi:hypothetical protein LTR62_008657 [Meristemomyces frigidus]|uniref:histidine kinase n=1 Tax=Meristemomyces frigidus TaxID=1508187 RepID=A0AAN7YCJ5_9PEZI|nr:hypothetical protein LTR62_008657 [Meristemomyces frigidus]
MERRSICFPEPGTQKILQHGDPKFTQELGRLFASSENDALESLILLKARLRTLTTEEFWSEATEGMSAILGAEMTFVIKRVLVDDQDAAVEMPPLGEPGSCIMAAAFHWCGQDGTKNTLRGSRFHAWGCPCAYMRHDKVFVIPENLPGFITNNPNKLPVPADAYLAVPLFADGKCFAHFGAMWSKDSVAQRGLSWAFIEMLFHALEDMMLDRFMEGSNFVKPAAAPRPRVIPHGAVSLAQSLRPYAPSLSHELRTPMQGVVGMLDVMYATVQEAVELQTDPYLREVFQSLKENIEVVQDSSRRAVEAADNFVHAADMDLTVPEAPSMPNDDSMDSTSPLSTIDKRPEILVAGSDLPLPRLNKRRRNEDYSWTNGNGNVKYARIDSQAPAGTRETQAGEEVSQTTEKVCLHCQDDSATGALEEEDGAQPTNGAHDNHSRLIAPGLRHTNMREIFRHVINEGLKMGGRPDSAIAQETEFGETIEVRSRGSDGTVSNKIIQWSVDPGVPQTIFIDEKDLTKLISCVFLNAIKFTDQNQGYVRCTAKMSQRGRYISVKVSDNGPGIAVDFLPKLFKPFSQGDGTTTRPSEGLGLGLLVAKGIARKLGGDIMCTRSETRGLARGSEFEIKIPVMAGETVTRPSSPFGSPRPRQAQVAQTEPTIAPPPFVTQQQQPQPLSQPQPTSHHLTRALENVFAGAHLATSDPVIHLSSPTQSVPTATRPKIRRPVSNPPLDRNLATKYPLRFLVAEDNKINRRLLVSMLGKFGYRDIVEAHDGAEAVRQMERNRIEVQTTKREGGGGGGCEGRRIDVVLMDLWMPLMDGYEATERILDMFGSSSSSSAAATTTTTTTSNGAGGHGDDPGPTVLAVTADVTDGALERAARVGMKGFMTKPYKLHDLQRLIGEYCARSAG